MKKILSLLVTFAPGLVLAAGAPMPGGLDDQTNAAGRSVGNFLGWIVTLSSTVIPILIILALVLFLYGIVKRFFWGGGDRGEAGKFILWGIVALFVMVSVWGLVNLLRNTFNLDNSNIPSSPSLPRQG